MTHPAKEEILVCKIDDILYTYEGGDYADVEFADRPGRVIDTINIPSRVFGSVVREEARIELSHDQFCELMHGHHEEFGEGYLEQRAEYLGE